MTTRKNDTERLAFIFRQFNEDELAAIDQALLMFYDKAPMSKDKAKVQSAKLMTAIIDAYNMKPGVRA